MTEMTLEQARAEQEAARARVAQADATVTRLWLEQAATDPLHPLHVAAGASHWHVRRHAEDHGDDDGRMFAAGTVFAALDHAGRELDLVTDHISDGVTAMGEAGEFEAAYECHTRVGSWAALARNAMGLHEHAAAAPWLRPPLYAGPDEQDNVRRLRQAAAHCVEKINNEGPSGFRIWECTDTDCAPADDE